MDIEFNIPLNREDLLSSNSDGYSVKTVFEPSCIDEKLEDCVVEYRNEGPAAITKQFDTFFSVLHHISRLQDEIKASCWEIILSNMIIHINSLPMILDPEGIDVQTRTQHLNTLKMESFILTQLMEAFESDATKPDITDTGKRGKGSKKKIAEKFDWSAERNRALTAIDQLIQLELHRLWDPPVVDEEFSNLFSGICYKLLENPSFVRQKEDRDVVIQILGRLIQRYNHQLGASLKIIQLLQHFEHLVQPLALALATFVTDFGAKNLVGDIIREIGRMDTSDLSRDTSGTRSFSLFLVDISDKLPGCVLPNISLLMTHLDGDSYTMRNGVLGVLGEIVVKVLSKDSLDDTMKKSRESFLDKLEAHVHDVHAFVRSKCLQIWLHLCQEKAIPISRQPHIIDLVIGRLHDKSSQVRKYAVQFLKSALVGNPFAAKLPIEQLTQSLEKEINKLKEMDPTLATENKGGASDTLTATPVITDEWLSSETAIKNALVKFFSADAMDESVDEIEIYEDDDDAIDKYGLQPIRSILQVQKYLKSGDIKSAIRHLQVAMETFKNCDDFEVEVEDLLKEPKVVFTKGVGEPKNQEDEIEEGIDEVEGEKEKDGEDKDKEEEEEEEMSKTPEVDRVKHEAMLKKYFILFRRIFHVVIASNDDENEEEMDTDVEKATQQQTEIQEETTKNPELDKQKVLVKYLQDCVKLAMQMRTAIPVLCQLMSSKINSDVSETIDFFIAAHEFGLSQSEQGIRRMANLIWARDPAIKKAVVSAFERLYIDIACENPRNKPMLIVKSLMSLIMKANLGELTSLEELICELMKMELIPQAVLQTLWQKLSLKIPNTTPEEQRAAINILTMMAGAEKDIIKSNLSVLIEHGLVKNKNYLLAKDTCVAILKLAAAPKNFGSANAEPLRLSSDHNLFSRLELMLVQGLTVLEDMTWTPFCEQAVSVIYRLSESPDTISGRIVKCLVKTLMGSGANNKEQEKTDATMDGTTEEDEIFPKASQPQQQQQQSTKAHPRIVARVLSTAGHIALSQLYHLDVSIFCELKRRHRVKEDEKDKKSQLKKNKDNLRKSMRDSSASTINSKKKEEDAGLEDELGVGGAQAEDAEAEYIRKVCEQEIVTGQNLLSLFGPVAAMICSHPSKYKNPELQAAASLALSKFMLVSSEFCDQHLRLLFTILEKSELPSVRSNCIITLGDLTFRFPNLIEPWTPHLYARLRDDSVEVRKTTVTILTHLILNDMVKVKGQISEMAVCLEDKEEKIASSAKMFFFELAQKGNAVYNIAPDIISRLSDPETGVDANSFRTIMKYLLQFIQKDKQAESLVEKLCHRYRATKTDRQWRDLAYCLSVLPFNEKAFKKLMENIACYKDKLSDDEVFNSFTVIIQKSKKFAKIEFKTMVEEFEKTLSGFHTKGADDNEEYNKAAKVLSQVASQGNAKNAGNTKNKDSKGRKKTASTRSRKPKATVDSDVSDESETTLKENKTPLPGRGKRKNTTRGRKAVRLNPTFSSDDDDIFD